MTEQHLQRQEGDNRPIPFDNYKFTPEELRVLRECNLESFYYRSLPLGTIFGVSTYYAVKSGYFKPSLRWGPVPKVMLAGFFGYMLGKISYQNICAEKIMRLPDSRLAEALRRRKGQMTLQESFGMDTGFTSLPLGTPEPEKKQWRADNEYRAVDLSLDAPPQAAGLDDTFRPSLDSTRPLDDSLPPPSQHTTSYEELRRRNREEYDQKRVEYRKPAAPQQPAQPQPQQDPGLVATPRPVYPRSGQPGSHKHKNEYGDVWED